MFANPMSAIDVEACRYAAAWLLRGLVVDISWPSDAIGILAHPCSGHRPWSGGDRRRRVLDG